MDILDRLRDLHKQATTENSHFYVAKCSEDAIAEIDRLRALVKALADQVEKAAFDMPPPNPHTPVFAALANAARACIPKQR